MGVIFQGFQGYEAKTKTIESEFVYPNYPTIIFHHIPIIFPYCVLKTQQTLPSVM